MTIKDIILDGGGVAIIIMTLLQIAPIKIDPWSTVARAIGKAINHDVIDKVDGLSKDLQALKQTCDEREALSRRTHILRFGDELIHGVKHTKEHFDQILMDCTEYENFCRDHPQFSNNVAQQTIRLIKNTYQLCMEEKTFL